VAGTFLIFDSLSKCLPEEVQIKLTSSSLFLVTVKLESRPY